MTQITSISFHVNVYVTPTQHGHMSLHSIILFSQIITSANVSKLCLVSVSVIHKSQVFMSADKLQ